MKCYNHPEKEAERACVECGKLFCSDCTTEIHGKSYCKACLAELIDKKNVEESANGASASQTAASANIQSTNKMADTTRTNKSSSKLGCLRYVTVALISILLFLFVMIAVFGNEESGTSNEGSNSTANAYSDTEKAIKYTPYDITAMIADLDSNALKAETTYQNAYIEITGVINTIDSDGKYITLIAKNDKSYGWDSIRCSLINDEQRSIIINKSKGDTITIRGQITSIGEVTGYALDVHTIK